MKKAAVIINVIINNEAYIVSYESGVVRTYKQATKPITEWLEAHQDPEAEEIPEEAPVEESEVSEKAETEEAPADEVPAEIALVEIKAEAETQVFEEATDLVEVVSDQDPAEGPGFGWRDALMVALAISRAIVVACKASAPVAKAACITLWHVACLVAMTMVSLVKTIRLYGPDVIAEVVTDAKVAYYKAKVLYFRTKRYGRIAIKGIREAAKLARGVVSTAFEVMAVGLHHLAGVAILVVLVVAKTASLGVRIASAAAGCAKSGWDLRGQIVREGKEA